MIVYLHGFNSTPQSKKATMLSAALGARGKADQFVCPALPHRPAEAIAMIENEMASGRWTQPIFVGSSLGGFYATYLAERHDTPAVLLNPAVRPARDLQQYLGPQQNLYSGERYELTPRHLAELAALEVPVVRPQRYLLIVETGDEVLDYREAVTKYAGARQVVIEGGDHQLASFADHLPLVLEFAGLG